MLVICLCRPPLTLCVRHISNPPLPRGRGRFFWFRLGSFASWPWQALPSSLTDWMEDCWLDLHDSDRIRRREVRSWGLLDSSLSCLGLVCGELSLLKSTHLKKLNCEFQWGSISDDAKLLDLGLSTWQTCNARIHRKWWGERWKTEVHNEQSLL